MHLCLIFGFLLYRQIGQDLPHGLGLEDSLIDNLHEKASSFAPSSRAIQVVWPDQPVLNL